MNLFLLLSISLFFASLKTSVSSIVFLETLFVKPTFLRYFEIVLLIVSLKGICNSSHVFLAASAIDISPELYMKAALSLTDNMIFFLSSFLLIF